MTPNIEKMMTKKTNSGRTKEEIQQQKMKFAEAQVAQVSIQSLQPSNRGVSQGPPGAYTSGQKKPEKK